MNADLDTAGWANIYQWMDSFQKYFPSGFLPNLLNHEPFQILLICTQKEIKKKYWISKGVVRLKLSVWLKRINRTGLFKTWVNYPIRLERKTSVSICSLYFCSTKGDRQNNIKVVLLALILFSYVWIFNNILWFNIMEIYWGKTVHPAFSGDGVRILQCFGEEDEHWRFF